MRFHRGAQHPETVFTTDILEQWCRLTCLPGTSADRSDLEVQLDRMCDGLQFAYRLKRCQIGAEVFVVGHGPPWISERKRVVRLRRGQNALLRTIVRQDRLQIEVSFLKGRVSRRCSAATLNGQSISPDWPRRSCTECNSRELRRLAPVRSRTFYIHRMAHSDGTCARCLTRPCPP